MRPTDLAVVRFGYPDQAHNPALAAWLRHLAAAGYAVREAPFDFRVDLVRNREVGRFMDETDAAALLMIDADMVPLADTDVILRAPGPVVFCPYVGQRGTLIDWKTQGLPTGCARIGRRVFEAVGEPWFDYQTDYTIRLATRCEAATFTEKIVRAGFEPRPVGRIGHLLRVVVSPPGPGHRAPETELEWKILHAQGLM